jgi:hypothetical protein|tara:strand:+ start:322 stop:531 length:210 start_codon:yes stop_codon:yes gene_type:complete
MCNHLQGAIDFVRGLRDAEGGDHEAMWKSLLTHTMRSPALIESLLDVVCVPCRARRATRRQTLLCAACP